MTPNRVAPSPWITGGWRFGFSSPYSNVIVTLSFFSPPCVSAPVKKSLSGACLRELFSKPLSGSILSRVVILNINPPASLRRSGATFRHRRWNVPEEEVALRYWLEGGRILKRRHASIACPPRNPPVCFPPGPFCFSSISDFATLASPRTCDPSSLCLPPVYFVVVRLSASTTTWQHLATSSRKMTRVPIRLRHRDASCNDPSLRPPRRIHHDQLHLVDLSPYFLSTRRPVRIIVHFSKENSRLCTHIPSDKMNVQFSQIQWFCCSILFI